MRQQTSLPYRRPALVMIWLVMATLALASCGLGGETAATTAPKTKISIQLSWTHEFSSAEFYTAEKNGRFAEQNLEVRLEEGGFKDNKYIEPIDLVLNGTVDFGMTNASTAIQARAEGKPVVAIAAILQRSPLAVISLSESGILRPQDLIGRRVAVADGGAAQVYNSLLTSQGIDPAKVHTVPRKTFGIDPLIKHEVDAIVAWVINEGVQVQEAGYTPNFIMMSDYGVDTYDKLLFTSEKMIAEHPDVVERLVLALTEGLQDVISGPDQATDFTLIYNSKLDREGQLRRLQASIPLLNPAGSRPGMMNLETWKTAYQILVEQGELNEQVDLNTAYTTAFLDKVYSSQATTP